MSVNPHPRWPGWWVVSYRPEGKKGKYVRSNIKGSAEEAMAYERSLRQIHISRCQTDSNPPFKDIAAEFINWAKTNNKSESYRKSIDWSLKNLLPVFGIFPPSRITYPLIEQFKNTRRHVPSACNHELEMLQIIINWGAMPIRSYCQPLPFRLEKLQVVQSLPQPPDPDEFDSLLLQIASNFKQARANPVERINKIAMLTIMYETGMRWIECRHIMCENIRRTDGRLYLGRTKTGKARYTYLSPEVMEIIKPILRDEGPLFINPRTEKIYTTMGKSLRNNAKLAGIRLKGTHTLRHAFGTDSMDASGDIRGTQELLGHTEIKSTTIYTHTATKRIKRLLNETAEYRDGERTGVVPVNKARLVDGQK